ncbi:MAG: LLM class flavin-dependent oxidoreductase [Thermomicrobiales bacterium]|nr:LLM class flavin-dependent oxidoreductase [Thermomicrobiales bacterium]
MATHLKIGVQLPEVEYVYTWPEYAEMARVAEDIGLDSIWVGDHLMYRYANPNNPPRGPFESWTTLSALAAVTPRTTRPPRGQRALSHTANDRQDGSNHRSDQWRTLHPWSGCGLARTEYRGFGIPYDHRFSRFAEAYQVIRELLTTGESTLHGEYYTIEDALLFPKPIQVGGPPIMIGSFGQKMLELTLPTAEMWNAWSQDYGGTFEGLQGLLNRIDGVCEHVGRDPATLIKTVAPLISMPGAKGRLSEYGAPPTIDGTDPHGLAAELHRFEEMGVQHLQLVLDPINAESIAVLDSALSILRG